MRPVVLVVSTVAILASASCTDPAPNSSPPSTLQIGVALPRSSGPSFGVLSFLSLLTREPLMGIGPDGRPSPKVVAEWKSDEAGRGIRLRIHPNIKFHDDSPLTAAIVREILLSDARGPNSPLSYSSITEITVVDDDELEISLSRPEAFLLTDLISTSVAHPQKPQLGTGPYRPSSLDASAAAARSRLEYARVEAYPSYYRGPAATQVIEIKAYETQRNAWAALMRGEINALHEVSPGAIEFVDQESSVQTYSFLRGYYSFLAFNMTHPVLARREVRQALNQAVNREEVVRIALKGRGQPADGPIWPYFWAYSTAQRGHAFNPEAARLRLDAAGFAMPAARLAGRMPSRLRFSCLMLDDPRFEQTALLIQKHLFDIGVDMDVEAVPFAELVARMSSGKFETLLLEYTSGRSVGWTYNVWHSSHPLRDSPRTGYNAADRVLDQLRHATTDQEIRAYVGELQKTFYDDPPAIFIAWPYSSRAVSTAFAVPQEQPNTDILGNIRLWRAQPHLARR